MYRNIFILNIDVEWAEQQHFNYLINVIEETAKEDNEDNKERKLSNADLLSVMA